MQGPSKRTQSPIVTGTSVIALKYADGVIMAADTLGSYGSLARFTNNQRIHSVHNDTLVAAGGDFSDFQYIVDKLESSVINDIAIDDGSRLESSEIFHYLQKLLYFKRNKFNPLWNSLVVAGAGTKKNGPFLGMITMIGTSFEDDYVATGFGHHFAIPILRKNWRPNLKEEEARALLEQCMKVCYYRDCRTINRIQVATVTDKGTVVSEPFAMQTEWGYQSFRDPKAGGENGGSW